MIQGTGKGKDALEGETKLHDGELYMRHALESLVTPTDTMAARTHLYVRMCTMAIAAWTPDARHLRRLTLPIISRRTPCGSEHTLPHASISVYKLTSITLTYDFIQHPRCLDQCRQGTASRITDTRVT